jgi:hypothetical protein
MKPFYRFAPQVLTEKIFYAFFPIWRAWVKSCRSRQCQMRENCSGIGATWPPQIPAAMA